LHVPVLLSRIHFKNMLSDDAAAPELSISSTSSTAEAVIEMTDTAHATISRGGSDDMYGHDDPALTSASKITQLFEAMELFHAKRWPCLPSVLDSFLRGAGQVIFLNSIFSGLLVIVALFVGNPWLGSLGFLGGLVATIAAAVARVQLEGADMFHDGLLSYNGVLVGCAFAVFLNDGHSWEWRSVVATIVGASFSAMMSLVLKAIYPKMPSWTWGFNIVAIPVLLFVRPLDVTTATAAVGQQVNTTTLNTTAAAAAAAAAAATAAAATTTTPMEAIQFLCATFSGMSQIFVLDSVIAGALLVVACFVFSPCLAATGVFGSALGTLTALACNADHASLIAGLHGYNPALTALAVGVFFVPTGHALVLGIGGAIATSVLSTGTSAAFGTAFSTPVLTAPFCVVASFCFYLGSSGLIPGLRIAPSPHSPEGNFKFRRGPRTTGSGHL